MSVLARVCQRYASAVVLAWLIVLIALVGCAHIGGSAFSVNVRLAGADSQTADDVLASHHLVPNTTGVVLVWTNPRTNLAGVAERARANTVIDQLAHTPGVHSVQPFYPARLGGQVSSDGHTAFVQVLLSPASPDAQAATVTAFNRRLATSPHGSLAPVFLVGGPAIRATAGSAWVGDVVGLAAAAVVLLLVFGSVTAAALPVATAVIALGVGLSVVTLLSHLFDIAPFAPELAALVGLGVGVDYALLVVSRYRLEMGAGAGPQAIANTLRTAGRSVIFAGITVCISLLGLAVVGVGFLVATAFACAAVVAISVVAALTLLPALLTLVGPRVQGAQGVGARRRAQRSGGSAHWWRWASTVQRHPRIAAAASLVVLGVIAAPALGLHLGATDARTDPPGSTSHRVWAVMSHGFGSGRLDPLIVVAGVTPIEPRLATPAVATVGRHLRESLQQVSGVSAVGPVQLSRDHGALTTVVYARTGSQEQATVRVLTAIRTTVARQLHAQGVTVHVTGTVAQSADFAQVLSSRMPLLLLVVVGFSLLLLMCVFRSVLVPLKAAVMNVAGVGAAFGVVTVVFGHGWAGSLIGVYGPGPVEPFLPVMLFAVLFGLSMDYEVFLVSAIHEQWVRTRDSAYAVRAGLASTGRIVTAAATIMVVVFASFVLDPDRVVKSFGVGLAAAVAIDAVLIRCVAVPALMALLGDRNWWMPAWLDRLLPVLALDEPAKPASYNEAGL